MIKFSLAVVLITGVLAGLANSQPSWVKSRTSLAFPENTYMLGIGFANKTKDRAADLQKAYDAAFADIAKQIKATVASQTSLQEYEVVSGNRSTLEQKTSAEIKVSSDIKLGGLRISDTYYDDDNGLVYALAVLNRITTGDQLKGTLAEYLNDYRKGMEQSRQSLNSGDVYHALLNLTDVLKNETRYNDLLPLYRFITNPVAATDSTYEMPGTLLISDTKAAVQSCLSRLKIEKVSGDTQSVSIKGDIKPLIVRVICNTGQQNSPVSGLKIKFVFRNGHGKLTEVATTDKSGIARSDIYSLSPSRTNVYSISALLDLSELKMRKEPFVENNFQDWNEFLERDRSEVVFVLRKSGASADDRLADAMLKLCSGVADSTASVAVSRILYQDKLPGPMAEFLRQRLESLLQSSTSLSVISQEAVRNSQIQLSSVGYDQDLAQPDYASQAAGAKYMVSGNYWKNGDDLDLSLKIIDVSTHILAGSSSTELPLSWLPKISFIPENYNPIVDDNIIKNEKKGEKLKIDVWVDRLDGMYHEGDTVRIYIRSNADCFAELVYNDAGGNSVLVFPNKVDLNSKLRGGVTYRVPGLFQVIRPFGREILKAYASDVQVPIPKGRESNGLIVLNSVDDFQKSVRSVGRSGNSYAENSTVIITMPR
jgi:LPP20 lipoprotein/Domain of unknown function (DUF4384)